jgi:ribosome-associated protein
MPRRPVRVSETIAIPLAEITLSYTRAGGPGGQNVNKVASKAVLRFSVRDSPTLREPARERALRRLASRLTTEGELVLTSAVHREQARNRAAVLARLAELLAAAVKPPRRRKKTLPSKAARERRLTAKRQRGARKRERRMLE